jgi:hypothetical protein
MLFFGLWYVGVRHGNTYHKNPSTKTQLAALLVCFYTQKANPTATVQKPQRLSATSNKAGVWPT